MSPLLSDLALLRRVGAIAIAVLALAIGAFMFLDGVTLRSPTRIRVLFRHTGGLRERAPLVVAGHAIGRIEAISPIPHGRAPALDGEVGVAVTVAVDASRAWQVPARAEIFVASRGPISDRFLEVAPRSGEPGPPIADGAELRGIDPPSLDGVLQHTWTHLTLFRDFTQAVAPELTALRRELDRLRLQLDALDRDLQAASRMRALIDAVQASIAAARHTHDVSLGGEPGVARLRATLVETRGMIGELRTTIDRLAPLTTVLVADAARVRDHVDRAGLATRVDQTIVRARTALDKIEPLVAIIDEIGQRIASGEGSVLRLIRDPEFPEDAKDLGKVIKRHPWRILEHAPRD